MANYAVMNTKGGTGKTIFSTQVLPAFFLKNEKINIFEIDNNNKSSLKNSKINFKTLDLDKAEEGLQEADYNFQDINVIDVGGGDDTKAVLNYINKNDIFIDAYFIPFLNDFEQIHNVKKTIELIKKVDSNAKIILVLNKVKSLEKEGIEEQFLFIFGSKKYGIEGALKELENNIENILFLKDSNIYSILKNIYNKSLADVLELAEDYTKNIREYKNKWRAELNVEQYKKNMQFYSFLKDAKELADINAKQLMQIDLFNTIK